MVRHTQQLVGKLPTNCLTVFSHFVRLELKGLKRQGFQNKHHVRGFVNFVHKKVKIMVYKTLPKISKTMLEKATHLGKTTTLTL